MKQTDSKVTRWWYFGLAIFASAFLLFQVQPVISKYILPWFGGGSGIWTTAQLFFQVALLGGYAYAHLLNRLPLYQQARWHVGLIVVVLVWLGVTIVMWGTPVTPGANWKPPLGADFPAGWVLVVLLVSVGLPFFLLATTSSLLQAWFGQLYRRSSPYGFYVLSNAASLLALLSYPFLFEPTLTIRQQGIGWLIGYGVYLAALALCVVRALRCREDVDRQSEAALAAVEPGTATEVKVPGFKDRLIWVNLAAVGSVMLLATTNQMTQNVASAPFLWVVPLSLYLLSFVVGFNDYVVRRRGLLTVLMLLALGIALVLVALPGDLPFWTYVGGHSFVLFVVCLFCHSELYARRPHPRYLTSFYLMLSLGGALGGVLVSLIAPLVLPDFWEYPLVLAVAADLVVGLAFRTTRGGLFRLRITVTVLALTLAAFILIVAFDSFTSAREVLRNFYGVMRVKEEVYGRTPAYTLVSGAIVHGIQPVKMEDRGKAGGYYSETSGAGLAFANHAKRKAGQPLRVGVLGLGVGMLAKYGNAGDSIRFYEIDPNAIKIANDTRYFTYLRDTKATVEIVEGDGRLAMEREFAEGGSQQYDLLYLDAFTGDSIPVHVLTSEALELYLQHLAPDGALVLNVSNKFLDLEPVLWRAEERLGLHGLYVQAKPEGPLSFPSRWVILSQSAGLTEQEEVKSAGRALQGRPEIQLWTDDYSNLFQVVR